jgi:hypothetical protein
VIACKAIKAAQSGSFIQDAAQRIVLSESAFPALGAQPVCTLAQLCIVSSENLFDKGEFKWMFCDRQS